MEFGGALQSDKFMMWIDAVELLGLPE